MGGKGEPSGLTLPLPGLSIFRKHRLVVVVGERVVEPGFDDWPDRFVKGQRGQALRIDMTRNHLNSCCQNVNRQGLTPLMPFLGARKKRRRTNASQPVASWSISIPTTTAAPSISLPPRPLPHGKIRKNQPCTIPKRQLLPLTQRIKNQPDLTLLSMFYLKAQSIRWTSFNLSLA